MTTCLFSPQALVLLGDDYFLGSIIQKIHPASYFGLISILIQCVFQRDKVIAIIRKYYGVWLLPLGATMVAIYDALILAAPATGLVDTWVLPAMIFMLCAQLNSRERGALRNLTNIYFVTDALIGIFETATNHRFVPIFFPSPITGEYTYPIEWRAGAILGHPLANAYLIGCFILMLFLDARVRPIGWRIVVIGICSVSMLAFGSRAAMGFLGIGLVLALIWAAVRASVTGKIAKDLIIYLFGGVVCVLMALPVLLATGFADRFIDRFSVDHGSAAARTGILQLVANLSAGDLIRGIPRLELVALGQQFNIGSGVENFWLGFLLSYGLIGYALFMPGLFVFCRNITQATTATVTPILLYFFACCSTSVSLSSKSLMFAIVTGLCLTSRGIVSRRKPKFAATPAPLDFNSARTAAAPSA